MRLRSFLLPAFVAVFLWSSQASAQTCEDERLSDAAVSILLERTASGLTSPPSPSEIRDALHEAGSSLPGAHVLIVPLTEGGTARRDRWLRERFRGRDAPAACGEAVGRLRVVVFAVRAGSLRLVEDSEDPYWHARWDEGFSSPYMVIVDSRGRAQAFRVPEDGDVFITEGAIRAQLIATGPEGPRPIAEWGQATLPALPAAPTEIGRLARLREVARVLPLRDNRLLRRAAARHAETVCHEHRARHVFGTWPADRMRRLGLRARILGETVARATTTAGALEALVQSPSHRMALVDRRFTDVGLAVVRDGGESCVVIFLAAWPQAVGTL